MAVLKEYVVKIKWKHDKNSKSAAIKELQKAFSDLRKDIEKTTKAAKEFFDTMSKGKGTGGTPGGFRPRGPRGGGHPRGGGGGGSGGALGPVLYQFYERSGPPGLMPLPAPRGMSYGGSSWIPKPLGLPGSTESTPSSHAADMTRNVELGTIGGVLAGFAGVTAIVAAIKELGKIFKDFGRQIIETRASSQAGGFGGLSPFLQHMHNLTGLNFQPFGGLTQMSYGASHRSPKDIQSLMSLYRAELMSGGSHSGQLAQFILNRGMLGNLSGKDLLLESLRLGGSNRDLTQELMALPGMSRDNAMAIAQNRNQILSGVRGAATISPASMQLATSSFIKFSSAISNLETQIENALIPSFAKLANSVGNLAQHISNIVGKHQTATRKVVEGGFSSYLNAVNPGLGLDAQAIEAAFSKGPGQVGQTMNNPKSNSLSSSMQTQSVNYM